MKSKWPLLGFSLLLFLVSCGARPAVAPKYRFEMQRPYLYQFKGNLALALDAGFLKYNGSIDLSADVEMTAVEKNEQGYKILLDIKNPQFTGGGSQLTPLFYIGINYIRTYLASFILSEFGKTTVIIGSKEILGLNSYAQILFPDFSDLDSLWIGRTENTNYPARFQEQEMIIAYSRKWKAEKQDFTSLVIASQYQFLTYEKEDYFKSVEPEPNGNLTVTMDDVFSHLEGKLTSKSGKIQVNLNLIFKQDILSYIISVQGNGDFSMTLVEKPA